MQPDGCLKLVQQVSFEGKASIERTWVLRRIDAHHYEASLTDAEGLVGGEAYGNLFRLDYDMRDPVLGRMHQWLYLQPDGQTVMNEATVSLLGVTVARLSERISHEVDPREHR